MPGPEKFITGLGCCSSCNICAETLECLHPNDPRYEDCARHYWLKKAKEKIQSEATADVKKTPVEPKIIEHEVKNSEQLKGVYLSCFNGYFAIFKRIQKSAALSYKLDFEESEALAKGLTDLGIPIERDISDMNLLGSKFSSEDKEIEDLDEEELHYRELENKKNAEIEKQVCSCRVVFSFIDMEFHVLNFNSYLIRKYHADKIAEAFKRKSITAKVEEIGTSRGPIQNMPVALPKPVCILKYPEPVQSIQPVRVNAEQETPHDVVSTPKVLENDNLSYTQQKKCDKTDAQDEYIGILISQFKAGRSVEAVSKDLWYKLNAEKIKVTRYEARQRVEAAILKDYLKKAM